MARKDNSPRRYAFIGWIVALVALAATLLLLLAKGALFVINPGATPDVPPFSTINIALPIAAGLVFLGLAAFAILDPDRVWELLTGRQARFGSNLLILGLALLGILIVVNYAAAQNPCPWKTCDVTEDQQHTLAPQTLQTLAALPGKVSAIAFFSSQTPTDSANQTLTQFKSNSNGKFDYRFDDPNNDPLAARQYGVTGDGKIVLLMGSQKVVTADASEQEITRGLVQLMTPAQRTVYFLTGHGEADINGTDTTSMSRASQTLQSRNFTVKTLSLASATSVPSDAKVIVIAGPKDPLLPQEITLLQAYLDKGGALIVMEDPTPLTNIGTNPDPLADYLKSAWGITLDDDLVVDTASNHASYAIGMGYNRTPADPIGQNENIVTIMPGARSLTISQDPPVKGLVDTWIISTADPTQQSDSWGETDFTSLKTGQPASFDPKADLPGPLYLAASAANPVTNGRIVVFGNSVFATDAGFDSYANGDIFVNAVAWAAQEQNLLNITTHQAVQRIFMPPTNPIALILDLLIPACLIPGLVVGAGIYAWLQRRRQA
jgi:ABC-type uncharacterized transport system involved in gliding motility auxiliary subunit